MEAVHRASRPKWLNIINASEGAPRLTQSGPGKPFGEIWQMAKYFVGAALQERRWRYNCYPAIERVDPTKPTTCRILMVSRWANALSKDARGNLRWSDQLYSSWPGEFFGTQRRISQPLAKEFFLKLSVMIHDQGNEMTSVVMAALAQFKTVYFESDWRVRDWTKGRKKPSTGWR